MKKQKLLDLLIAKLEDEINNTTNEGCNSGCVFRKLCSDIENEINMDLCVSLDILKDNSTL